MPVFVNIRKLISLPFRPIPAPPAPMADVAAADRAAAPLHCISPPQIQKYKSIALLTFLLFKAEVAFA
jgi:hypothetical protein